MHRLLPLPLAALALAALAPVASAGTVTAADASGGGPDPFEEYAITWTAAPGELNRLTVRRDGTVVTVADAGAPVTAGAGCEQVSPAEARCAVPATHGAQLRGAAGDGDDVVTAEGVASRVEGGAGNDRLRGGGRLSGDDGDDVLTGGIANDDLHGGAGADTLEGAGGRDQLHGDRFDAQTAANDRIDGGDDLDTVVYSGRTGAVEVDLALGRGGQAGETDVLVNVESAEGGAGPDRIAGDELTNELRGGAGDDVVSGRGGDDFLYGDDGDDLVDGGDGNDILTAGGLAPRGSRGDRLTGGAGDDRLRTRLGRAGCGAGDDRVDFLPARRTVPRTCERVAFRLLSSITAHPGVQGREVVFTVASSSGEDPLAVRRAVLRAGRTVLARSLTRTVRGGLTRTRWRFRLTAAGRRALRDGTARMTLRAAGRDRLTTVVRR